MVSGHLTRGGGRRPREVVGDNVGQPRDMADIAGAFCDESKLPLLPWHPWQRHPVEGGQERLVVCPELKVAALQHDPKVPDGEKAGQQLPVKSRVFHLCFRELPREKTEWSPSCRLLLLKDTADVAVGSISGQRQLSGDVMFLTAKALSHMLNHV